jgi:hypothetical protein
MKIAVLIGLLGLAYHGAQAQKLKNLPTDPAEFYEAWTQFLKAAKNHDLDMELEQFDLLWQGGSLGYEAEASLVKACNTMYKSRYIPHPDFTAYLRTINSFYANEIDEENLVAFNQTVDTLIGLRKGKAEVRTVMDAIYGLNKHQVLAGKKGKEWGIDHSRYTLTVSARPKVEVENVQLSLRGTTDTLLIENTGGRFNLATQTWRGHDGEVNWERVGLAPGSVYAQLGFYKIDMTAQGYSADSVEFINSDAFPGTMAGKLTDNLDGRNAKKATYPQFRSHQRKFTLDDLDDYLIYKGGFGMQGATIIGAGVGNSPAQLTILREGRKFMQLRSKDFFITPTNITASNCGLTIYIDNDSIYHSSLYLQLERDKAYLTLSLPPGAALTSPFTNTYHQLDMFADMLECYVDSSYFDISSRRDPDGLAVFESRDYFNRQRVDKLQANMGYNPLFKLNMLFTTYQRRYYPEEEIAGWFGAASVENIQPLLMVLASQGFIIYNTEMKEVYLQDKLFTYINAYLRKTDYDVILIKSQIKGTNNSRFYHSTNELMVRGVQTVRMSDSSNVQIYPAKQTIRFRKDRDMVFDGYLKAGRFEYFGKNFEFSYRDFLISMNQVDSMMFNFPDEKAGGVLRRVNTVIQDITGKLMIDKPDNKSGRLLSPNYPIFDCTQGAYVYYDYKSIYNGVYDRDRFHFKLKPFVVDSLDKFSMKGLNLNGTFVSANILPSFDYRLTLQPDFSLGFGTETPESGYPLYSGTGHCHMKIFLSNKGLKGDGRFTYNGAEVQSNDMIFFPDSMMALKTVFSMDDSKRKRFPQVNSSNCLVTWTPYRDTMIIAAIDSTAFINMYEPESFLRGQLVFTQAEMYGKGEFNYRQSLINSEYYNFKHRDLSADSTRFNLYDETMQKPLLNNDNVRVTIDFDKQLLYGEINDENLYTMLLHNSYSTNIPQFKWDVAAKKVYLEKGTGNDEIDFFFVSTNPAFDSLSFTPKSAELDLTTLGLQAHDIAYFVVGDAKVKPEGSVTIGENGEIPALENAEILASAENEYHLVKKAAVNIFSSKRLTASGMYQYTDPNGKLWEIAMDQVSTTDQGTTQGIGTIPDSMGFHFGDFFSYSGNLIFESNRKEIAFEGEVNVEHPTAKDLATEKFVFKGLVAFDSLYFDVSNAKNALGQELHTGLFLNSKTRKLYPLLLGVKQTPDDLAIYRAQGDLYYDSDTNSIVITQMSRYHLNDIRPAKWEYNIDQNFIAMDGPYNLGYQLENFDFNLSSLCTYSLSLRQATMHICGGISIPIDVSAANLMSDSLITLAYFNPDLDNNKGYLRSTIGRKVLDNKDLTKMMEDLTATNEVPYIKDYSPLLFFGETEMVWDTTSKSFQNRAQIGLANLTNHHVNKYLNGRLGFFKTLANDSISIYMESSDNNWYLFTFVDEEMFIGSSDNEFVIRAMAKKPKEVTGRLQYREATADMITRTRQNAVRIKN